MDRKGLEGRMQENGTIPIWRLGRHGQDGPKGLFLCCIALYTLHFRVVTWNLHFKNITSALEE